MDYSHDEQLEIIENLCQAGQVAKALALWEICAQPMATEAERERMEAMFAAYGCEPAKEIFLGDTDT